MIKMEAEDLIHIISRAGTTNRDESIAALLTENNALKKKLDEAEHNLATEGARSNVRVMTAAQQASFPAMNAERQRIARGIVQYFETAVKQKQRPTADKLLFGLALGDLV